jgi:hypothetical protein
MQMTLPDVYKMLQAVGMCRGVSICLYNVLFLFAKDIAVPAAALPVGRPQPTKTNYLQHLLVDYCNDTATIVSEVKN